MLGLLLTNLLLISTRPASSSFVRWLDRFPLVSPVVRCRKTKSASLTEDRTVKIASRPGSWISRSRFNSSLCPDIAVRDGPAFGRGESANEEAVVEDSVRHARYSRENETDVARVGATPDGQEAGKQETTPDDNVVRSQPRDDRLRREHEQAE